MKNGLAALSEQLCSGAVVEHPELAVSFDELNELVGFEDSRALEQRFVTRH